jgi:hypothetical protein
MSLRVNLIGKKFGRLIVKREGRKRKYKRYLWCQCTCPAKTWVLVQMGNLSLTRPHTQSCGCLREEKAKAVGSANSGKFEHGLSNSKAYRALANAKSRCSNPNSTAYSAYGAKGIRVDARWMSDPNEFLKDMGNPAEGRSLDRLDSRGNYSAQNCHWATRKQQQQNQTRKSILFQSIVRYISKPGKSRYKRVDQSKTIREIGAVMTPAQTGVCGCGRRCFYDDKFCGRAECDNDETKAKWKPFVESETPQPINIWKPKK